MDCIWLILNKRLDPSRKGTSYLKSSILPETIVYTNHPSVGTENVEDTSRRPKETYGHQDFKKFKWELVCTV